MSDIESGFPGRVDTDCGEGCWLGWPIYKKKVAQTCCTKNMLLFSMTECNIMISRVFLQHFTFGNSTSIIQIMKVNFPATMDYSYIPFYQAMFRWFME